MAEYNSRHPYLSLLRPGEGWLHSLAGLAVMVIALRPTSGVRQAARP